MSFSKFLAEAQSKREAKLVGRHDPLGRGLKPFKAGTKMKNKNSDDIEVIGFNVKVLNGVTAVVNIDYFENGKKKSQSLKKFLAMFNATME